ncbi:hypothetical protein BLNAU_13036 [Blattamonas nauphoetae]|uniref:F-box/LRR-repeat protein 15/At3g58940/PEG3-like LRR domain-containing protein n=1 Tax=Blattamonas nauphoetae TaxID=2049346 RepID=A0ABQ9XJZ6_9EUKA|nr:hypothetical protein BLNAU_13036 [Blattamonas nauphoetae]
MNSPLSRSISTNSLPVSDLPPNNRVEKTPRPKSVTSTPKAKRTPSQNVKRPRSSSSSHTEKKSEVLGAHSQPPERKTAETLKNVASPQTARSFCEELSHCKHLKQLHLDGFSMFGLAEKEVTIGLSAQTENPLLAGQIPLPALPELVEFRLSNSPHVDPSLLLQSLAKQAPSLKSLTVRNIAQVRKNDATYHAESPFLSAQISRTTTHSSNLDHISSLPLLQHIDLRTIRTNFVDLTIRPMLNLGQLSSLYLSPSPPLVPSHLKQLAVSLPKLVSLSIGVSNVTQSSSLLPLTTLPNLQNLVLTGSLDSWEAISVLIRRSRQLRTLRLTNPPTRGTQTPTRRNVKTAKLILSSDTIRVLWMEGFKSVTLERVRTPQLEAIISHDCPQLFDKVNGGSSSTESTGTLTKKVRKQRKRDIRRKEQKMEREMAAASTREEDVDGVDNHSSESSEDPLSQQIDFGRKVKLIEMIGKGSSKSIEQLAHMEKAKIKLEHRLNIIRQEEHQRRIRKKERRRKRNQKEGNKPKNESISGEDSQSTSPVLSSGDEDEFHRLHRLIVSEHGKSVKASPHPSAEDDVWTIFNRLNSVEELSITNTPSTLTSLELSSKSDEMDAFHDEILSNSRSSHSLPFFVPTTQLVNLTRLHIKQALSIDSLSLRSLPSLTFVTLTRLPHLKSVTLHSLPSLSHLTFTDCPHIKPTANDLLASRPNTRVKLVHASEKSSHSSQDTDSSDNSESRSESSSESSSSVPRIKEECFDWIVKKECPLLRCLTFTRCGPFGAVGMNVLDSYLSREEKAGQKKPKRITSQAQSPSSRSSQSKSFTSDVSTDSESEGRLSPNLRKDSRRNTKEDRRQRLKKQLEERRKRNKSSHSESDSSSSPRRLSKPSRPKRGQRTTDESLLSVTPSQSDTSTSESKQRSIRSKVEMSEALGHQPPVHLTLSQQLCADPVSFPSLLHLICPSSLFLMATTLPQPDQLPAFPSHTQNEREDSEDHKFSQAILHPPRPPIPLFPTSLTVLAISHCSSFSDAVLFCLPSQCPHLSHLFLSNVPVSSSVLSKVIDFSPTLQIITLSSLQNLTALDIASNSIDTLVILDCVNLKSIAISSDSLKCLNVTMNPNVNNDIQPPPRTPHSAVSRHGFSPNLPRGSPQRSIVSVAPQSLDRVYPISFGLTCSSLLILYLHRVHFTPSPPLFLPSLYFVRLTGLPVVNTTILSVLLSFPHIQNVMIDNPLKLARTKHILLSDTRPKSAPRAPFNSNQSTRKTKDALRTEALKKELREKEARQNEERNMQDRIVSQAIKEHPNISFALWSENDSKREEIVWDQFLILEKELLAGHELEVNNLQMNERFSFPFSLPNRVQEIPQTASSTETKKERRLSQSLTPKSTNENDSDSSSSAPSPEVLSIHQQIESPGLVRGSRGTSPGLMRGPRGFSPVQSTKSSTPTSHSKPPAPQPFSSNSSTQSLPKPKKEAPPTPRPTSGKPPRADPKPKAVPKPAPNAQTVKNTPRGRQLTIQTSHTPSYSTSHSPRYAQSRPRERSVSSPRSQPPQRNSPRHLSLSPSKSRPMKPFRNKDLELVNSLDQSLSNTRGSTKVATPKAKPKAKRTGITQFSLVSPTSRKS